MKQVLYDKKGMVFVDDVPAPAIGPNEILVKNEFSLLSPGTEKSMISLMKKPLYKMALERKDLTKQVIKFAKESGVKQTMDLVKSRLDVWHLLGYSCAGTVEKVGANIEGIGIGDMVACTGSGFANHAEYIASPKNMFARAPKGVSSKEAAFAGIGAIAMQSIRQLNPTLGETHVVLGMGLIGQIVAQLLKANGCKVIGIDPDKKRAEKDYVDLSLKSSDAGEVYKFTRGVGADGVIIAASAKAELANDAFDMCRKKGRVVLLGVCDLNIDRSKMYEKELEFKISTSFGPGYYDPSYESKSIDYPISHVRWTMNRNMDSFLELIKEKKVSVDELVDEEIEVEKAREAYRKLFEKGMMGVLIRYKPEEPVDDDYITVIDKDLKKKGKVSIGLIGAGNFTKAFLIPAIAKVKDMQIRAIATKTGPNSKKLAKELGAKYSTTDYKAILKDKNIDLVVIATRHDTHAEIAIEAIKAKKHIYVEKPAAITEDELKKLKDALHKHKKVYAVGFNRRYSPAVVKLKEHLKPEVPMIVNYVFNNTYLPADHWVNQKDVGGGRVLGEACHIFDLFNFLTGSRMKRVFAEKISSTKGQSNDDNNIIATVKYDDGSVCNLIYSCIGNSKAPRERCTVFQDGDVIEMDSFATVSLNSKKVFAGSSDLGYSEEMKALHKGIAVKESSLISAAEGIYATEAAFAVMRSIKGK